MQRSIISFCSLFYIVFLLLIPAIVQAGEIIKVDALVVSSKNMAAAETKARHLALDRALTMMGNKKILAAAKKPLTSKLNNWSHSAGCSTPK